MPAGKLLRGIVSMNDEALFLKRMFNTGLRPPYVFDWILDPAYIVCEFMPRCLLCLDLVWI